MRLSVRSLRRVVKGDLRIDFVRQDLTSYGGLEWATRATQKAEAKKLLAAAGFGPGHPLKFTVSTRSVAIFVDTASWMVDPCAAGSPGTPRSRPCWPQNRGDNRRLQGSMTGQRRGDIHESRERTVTTA